jgi:regulator of sigma E protease
MLTTLFTVVVVALLFGLTVFVHEFGHFLAARACGLVVDVFSIGFGPALWSRRIRGVTYKIGCLPLGGYVALPQLDPSGTALVQGSESTGEPPPAGKPDGGAPEPVRQLPAVAPWKRILVSAAGAVGNIILAVILAWTVYLVGKPATPSERSATVGFVDKDSAAWQAGLRLHDEVLAVNGEPVANWTDFLIVCSRSTQVVVSVRRGTETLALPIVTERGVFGQQTVGGVDGRSLCMVRAVEEGMSAARAGLTGGDIIVGFNGQEVISMAQLIALVAERKGQPTPIQIKRGGALIEATVTPDVDPATGQVRIGIRFNTTEVDFDVIVHPRPMDQLRSHATAIVRMLSALTTRGEAGPASRSVGGPLAILISYYYIVKASLMVAVWFTGFLNVNLAILNLLPIPVLDGGHILFALWQMVFRRPVNARFVTVITNAFALLLIGVFILLTGRDIWRFTPAKKYWDRIRGTPREAAMPEARTNAAPEATGQTPEPVPAP